MACVSTETRSELEFVRALYTRSPGRNAECRGPGLLQRLSLARIIQLERIFHSAAACEVLWSGFIVDELPDVPFRLCAAHWFDLACLAWARALQQYRVDWAVEAENLLEDLCREAGWDAKEIVNMFVWQHARLT